MGNAKSSVDLRAHGQDNDSSDSDQMMRPNPRHLQQRSNSTTSRPRIALSIAENGAGSRQSMTPHKRSLTRTPGSARFASSVQMMEHAKRDRSSISSACNRRPLLTAHQRAIVKYCLENARADVAERIHRRMMDKRDDFRAFLDNLSKAQRVELADTLKDFLLKLGDRLTDSDEIQRMAEELGAQHVPYRNYGFKPDFFAVTADLVAIECTFLDAAAHGASDTAAAWSQLSAFAFSSVRDGYYAELRRQRKASGVFRSRPSYDISTDGSTTRGGADDELSLSRRSVSPATDEDHPAHTDSTTNTNGLLLEGNGSNFLLPPQVY